MDMKLDLHKLFLQVASSGGAAAVSKEGAWSRVMDAVFSTADAAPGAAAQLRLLYEQALLALEHRCVKTAEGSTSKCVWLGFRACAATLTYDAQVSR